MRYMALAVCDLFNSKVLCKYDDYYAIEPGDFVLVERFPLGELKARVITKSKVLRGSGEADLLRELVGEPLPIIGKIEYFGKETDVHYD